jgi:ribosomal protein S18 acetylase RimI-like enzyme
MTYLNCYVPTIRGYVAKFYLREFKYPGDYLAIRNLWENAGIGIQLRRSDDPEEIQKKLRHDPDLFLVAELRGKIIGSVIGGFDGRRGMVYHLAVDGEYQRQGIGEALMDELERRLKDKGCIRCYLMVTDENISAMHFYERRGWIHMNKVRTYGKDLA